MSTKKQTTIYDISTAVLDLTYDEIPRKIIRMKTPPKTKLTQTELKF